jgi:cation diffusion facilitator family transporter
MADAFNNLSDAASSVISFIGVKLAERPADKEHPFGHGRFEYISALAVAFLILQVGFNLFQSSFQKVLHPEALNFNPILTGILCVSVLLKVWMMFFNRKLGKRIKSTVMLATSADSMGDVFVTSATIISTIIGGLTGLKIDGIMGIVVSLFVMFAGFRIAKDTLEPLLGQPIEREVFDEIINLVESHDGIVGTHDLIIHNYGPTKKMATLHAEVPNNVNLDKIHDTIDLIEKEILETMDIFCVIHMDPVEVNDVKVLEKKQLVIDIITNLEPKASIHDFRVINGERQINLIFDLVIPYSYKKTESQKLMNQIMEEVKNLDERYHCIINMENSFVAER